MAIVIVIEIAIAIRVASIRSWSSLAAEAVASPVPGPIFSSSQRPQPERSLYSSTWNDSGSGLLCHKMRIIAVLSGDEVMLKIFKERS